ncbi:MAG: helix-turn-helix transcriptional regulator [Prevotella sp.]|nr:helix-turn-helix transcriptional regulator [Prevotella sp.]
MSKILADNVRRICKAQGKQMKDLAASMGIDPASLTRALNGNARLDTIQKIATALGVSLKSLFEPMDDVEGFIRIRGKAYQFNSRAELDKLLNNEDEVKRQEGNNYDRV